MNDTAIPQVDTLITIPGARARAVAAETLAACIDVARRALAAWRAAPPSVPARDTLSRARADLFDALSRSARADHAKALWDGTGLDVPYDYVAETEATLAALDAAADAETASPDADTLVVLHVVRPGGDISYELSWQRARTVDIRGLAESMASAYPDAVTRWWITDREGTLVRDEFEPLRQSGRPFATITLTHEDREFTYLLPAAYEVCHRCEGHGTHLTPSIGMHAYSAEEFNEAFCEDEDRAAYFQRGGKYDVECETCGGKRVVPEVDPAALNPRQKRVYAAWEAQREDDWEFDHIRAAERAMGA